MEMKCTINVMLLNHPKIIPSQPPSLPPSLWKNHLPRNRSLVPKRLGTAALGDPAWQPGSALPRPGSMAPAAALSDLEGFGGSLVKIFHPTIKESYNPACSR